MIKIQKILDKQKEIDFIRNELEVEIRSLLEQFSCLDLDFDELDSGEHSLYAVEGIPLKRFPTSFEFDVIYQMVIKKDPKLMDEEFDNEEESMSLANTLIKNNIEPESLYEFIQLARMIDFPAGTVELVRV